MNEEGCVTEMHAHIHTQLTLTGPSQRRIKNIALDVLKPTWKIAAVATWKPRIPSIAPNMDTKSARIPIRLILHKSLMQMQYGQQ